MTELNEQLLNEAAQATFKETVQLVEEGKVNDEQFLGIVYGNLVAASALGWDIDAMVYDAKLASDRLLRIIEQETENETQTETVKG